MSTTNPTRITSEWDDIQVKFGNYAPLLVEETEEQKTIKFIEQTEEAIRSKRLEQLKKKFSKKFGRLVELTSDNFIENVTNYSKEDPVIVFLYDKSGMACQLLKSGYEILAKKYPNIKFTIGEAKNIISNATGSTPSAFLVYKDCRCIAQINSSQIIALQGSHLADKRVEDRAADAILRFIVNSGIKVNSDSDVSGSDSDGGDLLSQKFFGRSRKDSDSDRSDEEFDRLKSKAFTSNIISQVLNNRK